MEQSKKVKPKYSFLRNIGFAMGNVWRWDRVYYMPYILKIPISVLLPLGAVYFPKLLIELIEQKTGDIPMLTIIGAYCLALLTAGLVNLFCEARINSTSYVFSLRYQRLCDLKEKTMDYESSENPKIADMRMNTYGGAMSAESVVDDINGLLINLLGIFTYGGIIVMVNPFILLLLAASSAINYIALAHVRKYTDRNKDKWTPLDRKNDYLHKISSQYEHAKDIKIYHMKEWLSGLLTHYQGLRMEWYRKIYNKNFMTSLVDGGLRFVRDGVSYALLIYMLLEGRINIGSFVFYFGAIAGLSGWLSSVVGQFASIVSHNVEINRLRAYLDLEDRFNHGKGAPLPKKSEAPYEIEFRGLTYTYPEREKPTIDNVSLTIKKGEKLAVVGLNGAGKTTLVKLMCGLYYPTGGAVLLNGVDMKEYNIDDYYTQFSAVFQEINLIPVTIAEFVSGSGENTDKKRAWDALRQAGLEKVVKGLSNGIDTTLVKGIYDDGVDLSGGEKQKLMLARALYKDAPVIVLDEPTAALDPIAENDIYMKYAELTKGKTSVFISHRLSSTRFCDRIIFVQDGKIAELGSHDELMKKKGLYANMFEIQSHYYKDGEGDENER